MRRMKYSAIFDIQVYVLSIRYFRHLYRMGQKYQVQPMLRYRDIKIVDP